MLTQLSLYSHLNVEGASPVGSRVSIEENSLSPTNLSRGRPVKSSTTFVVGRNHEFVEDERKIRKMQLCSYCKGVIQGECVWRSGECVWCLVSVCGEIERWRVCVERWTSVMLGIVNIV